MTVDPIIAPSEAPDAVADARRDDWSAFSRDNTIGDAGRQPDVVPVLGQLTVGVPDSVLDFFSDGDLEVRGCATRGWSHRHAGTPRQDFFAVQISDDLLIVAVADGVSAGAHSHVAAETAARSVCKLVAERWRDGEPLDWEHVSRRVSMRILEEAEYRQLVPTPTEDASIDDRLRTCLLSMSTTLVVCAMRRRPTHLGYETWLAILAGDSGAYQITSTHLNPLSGGKDQTSVIASSAVRPLPGVVTPQEDTFHLQPGGAILLCSDGIGDPVGDGSGDVGQELASRWASPPTIDAFLKDVNFYRKTFDDDRTAVGIWVRPDACLPPERGSEPEPEHQALAHGLPKSGDVADVELAAATVVPESVTERTDHLAPPEWVNEGDTRRVTGEEIEPHDQ